MTKKDLIELIKENENRIDESVLLMTIEAAIS